MEQPQIIVTIIHADCSTKKSGLKDLTLGHQLYYCLTNYSATIATLIVALISL